MALLPVSLVLLLTGTELRESIINAEFSTAEGAANRVEVELNQYLERIERIAEDLRLDPMLNDPDTPAEARDREIQRLVGAQDLITSGRIMPGIESGMKAQVYNPKSKESELIWRVPLKGTGETLELHSSLADIWRIMDPAELGKTGGAVLLDPNGWVLAHRNKTQIHSRVNFKGLGKRELGYTDPYGDSFLTIARPIVSPTGGSTARFRLVFLIPKQPIDAVLMRTRVGQMGIGVLTSIVALIVGAMLARRLARGLEVVSSVSETVAGGNIAARLPDEGPAEIRRLAGAINHMIDELEAHQNRLGDLVQARTTDLAALTDQHRQVAAQLKAANDASKDGLWLVSVDGVPLSHNMAFSKMFDIDEDSPIEEVGRKLLERFDDADAVLQWLDRAFGDPSKPPEPDRFDLSDSDDGVYSGYAAAVREPDGAPFAILFAFRDLSEEQRLQHELSEARRMEAVGHLTGSIAHEFNNLLTSVIGNIELVDPESGESSSLGKAHSAASRAAELVRGLLSFSQQSWLEIHPVSVPELFDSLRLRYQERSEPINWVFDLPQDLWPVAADQAKLHQVVEQLCDNALEAGAGNCRIAVAARNVSGEDSCARVEITISDDGGGVDDEVRERMFEPFYSTKNGRPGLGLAMCQGLIRQHGGSLIAEPSSSGNGLTLKLTLDAVDPKLAMQGGLKPISTPEYVADSTERCVFVVDDDPHVRLVTEAILKRGGYRVHSFEDGPEALKAYRSLEEQVSLVVLDLRMPKMMGTEVLERLRRNHAFVPVIICSGYLGDFDPVLLEGLAGPQALLEKPVGAQQLLSAAEDAIALVG